MPKRPVPLWYVLVSGFGALALGIVLTWVGFTVAAKGSRMATCAVVNASREEKRAQLRAYDETPPTTEAGRNLQQKTQEAEQRWDDLWKTLGCKAATDGN